MRLLLLLAVWLVLTNGDPQGWLFGLAVVAVAWVTWVRLFPPLGFRVRPLQVPVFLGWFMARSLVAGLDVTRRLLSPSLPVAPGLRRIRISLPSGSPRWLLANLLSLLPGTLSVRLEASFLLVHCLDTRQDVESDVKVAEYRVARLFGLSLAEEKE